jgi:hypothetical protein
MQHLCKKGDEVNVFQMSAREGLVFEGRATVLKPIGSVGDERYLVRFHGPDGKPSLGEEYERFVDREGQDDPQAYIKMFNKRLGVTV